MNEDNIQNDEYIEIDLKEYLYILWKNKALIIAIVLIALLGSFFVSNYLMTNIYKTSSVVRLTNLNSSNFSNPETSQKIIKSRAYINEINNRYDMNLENDYINKLISPDNNTLLIESNNGQFININIAGQDPKKITSIVNNISEHFVELTENDVNKRKSTIDDHIDSLLEEKDSFVSLNKNVDNIIESLNNDNTSQMELNYLQNTLIDVKKSLNEFSLTTINQIFALREELNNISSAQVVSAAEVPENPSEPNTKLNVAIGFVLGLFLAIFIIFIKEFLKGTNWSKYEKN